MDQLSYCRHRFPSAVIQHAIWLYLRFTLSYRDVEDLLAERGLAVSYETVRRWVLKVTIWPVASAEPAPTEQSEASAAEPAPTLRFIHQSRAWARARVEEENRENYRTGWLPKSSPEKSRSTWSFLSACFAASRHTTDASTSFANSAASPIVSSPAAIPARMAAIAVVASAAECSAGK